MLAACPDADTVDLSRCWDRCGGPESVVAVLEAVASGVRLRRGGRQLQWPVLGACPALDDDCLHQLLILFPFLRHVLACAAGKQCSATLVRTGSYSLLLIPYHSLLHAPRSSLLTPHPPFLIPHFSLLTAHICLHPQSAVDQIQDRIIGMSQMICKRLQSDKAKLPNINSRDLWRCVDVDVSRCQAPPIIY